MRTEVIIVSRHPAAIEFIRQAAGLPAEVPVMASADVADVAGKIVYGNLPLHLAAAAAAVVAVEFTGPPPRGTEYGVEEMIAAGAQLRLYITRSRQSVLMPGCDDVDPVWVHADGRWYDHDHRADPVGGLWGADENRQQ